MAKRSVFKENQRLTGTLFTVVGQANEGSWQSILCRCDCGTEAIRAIQSIMSGQSKGCKRCRQSRWTPA